MLGYPLHDFYAVVAAVGEHEMTYYRAFQQSARLVAGEVTRLMYHLCNRRGGVLEVVGRVGISRGELGREVFDIGEVHVHESVKAGLAAVKPWGHLGDVGAAVHQVALDAGFSVVEEYGGHGIGCEFHEDPFVSFTSEAGTGPILMPGMCFTIEPMVNAGDPDIYIDRGNGWVVRTVDGSDSAQWEVQLVVTDTGYELLSW